jgi:hypothetical protein
MQAAIRIRRAEDGDALELSGLAERKWLGIWERNPRALASYQKWGFEVVADHIFTVGNDPQRDLIMRRALDAARAQGGSTAG